MISGQRWFITSFYQFVRLPADTLELIQSQIRTWIAERGVIGLVLVATEGLNATVAGSEIHIQAFKDLMRKLTGIETIRFKDSSCQERPFHRTSVDIRAEIVALKRPDLLPLEQNSNHLSPAEWHEWIESDRPKVMVDTRNDYEINVGKFAGAVVPGLKSFSEWSDYADKANLPKDTTLLIYCTGGIRCEKVMLDMKERGYEKIYQLQDGILGYLTEFPDGHFEGECFVYDDRVAVGAGMAPTTKYGICPGCGHPGDIRRVCELCDKSYFTCDHCKEKYTQVCSKTCGSYFSVKTKS